MSSEPVSISTVCIGSLALGLQYRIHAKLLAFDLLCFHPEIKLVLLTDKPSYFDDFPNVIAVKHKSTGIRACYHDKRFVFKVAFEQYDTCIFMDADSRLVSPIDFDEILANQSFIIAFVGENLANKIRYEIANNNKPKSFNGPLKKERVFENLGRILSVDLDSVQFVQEAIFIINKERGNFQAFFIAWDYCATYATARLLESSEGSSIGISACYAKGAIYSFNKAPPWYFKDLYTNHRHKNKQQALLSVNLTVLRRSLSNEGWGGNQKIRLIAGLAVSAIVFYTRSILMLSKHPLRIEHEQEKRWGGFNL